MILFGTTKERKDGEIGAFCHPLPALYTQPTPPSHTHPYAVHAYERNHRTYNKARDIKAPVQLTLGDAGNREGLYTTWLATPTYSAFHQSTYGHGELRIFNSTHAFWDWHCNPDSEVIVRDSVWVIKGEDA